MITYFLITFVVLALFLVFMSLGIFFGKDPLKGSCGGLGKVMGSECELCGDKDKCEKRLKDMAAMAAKSSNL
jgi:hypothetical protein